MSKPSLEPQTTPSEIPETVEIEVAVEMKFRCLVKVPADGKRDLGEITDLTNRVYTFIHANGKSFVDTTGITSIAPGAFKLNVLDQKKAK